MITMWLALAVLLSALGSFLLGVSAVLAMTGLTDAVVHSRIITSHDMAPILITVSFGVFAIVVSVMMAIDSASDRRK